MTVGSLHQLFDPQRIVWIGADEPGFDVAASAERNLWHGGFARSVLAVRSTGYASAESRVERVAAAVPGPGLAVICLPQPELPALLGEVAAIGCRAAILIGGGLASALSPEQAVATAAAARTLDLRLVGPDRVGVIVPAIGLNAGCAADMPPSGDLALVTQSDSIATALLAWATERRIGFSRVVSLGDGADVEFGDILDFLALDLTTRAILVHLQGVADARRFMSAARAAARVKPVIVLKSGRQVGSVPACDAGPSTRLHRDRVYDAAFTRAGMVRVDTIEELFAAAASLGANAARRGSGLRKGRLAILTNGHAPAELAADVLLAGGGSLITPADAPNAAVARTVGQSATHASAVDLGLEAGADSYAAGLDVLLDRPGIDAVMVVHAPMSGIDPTAIARSVAETAARRRPRGGRRPVIAAWLGEAAIAAARKALDPAGIPVFSAPEPAVRAFLHRVQHERRQFLLRQVPSSRQGSADGRDEGQRLIRSALESGRTSLSESEAMHLLAVFGIPAAATGLAPDLDAAAAVAAELGYPVALKVVSAGMPQKSAAGGVALDVADAASLHRRGRQILERFAQLAPGVPVEGLLVQRMERSLFPIELYLGMEVDPTFGPILMVGHAAQAVTAADLAYLLPPLDATLAEAALNECAVGRFLARQPDGTAMLAGVVDALVRLSQLVIDLPSVQRVAIDPFQVSRNRLVVLDAHVDLAKAPPGVEADARLAIRPYPRHLEQTALLRDGRSIRLRPIRPEDAPALKELFSALTPEHRRLRLFSSMREIPDELAARLTQIDYDREMVLVALDPDQPARFWGGGRIAADADNCRAEYSVTVRSDRQGLGLGRICLERVLDYARARGIEEVWGSVLAENEGMLALAQRLGFDRHRDPDSPELFITVKRMKPPG